MKTIVIAFLSLIFSTFAIADIVKFETNDFSKKLPLTWCGILQKIDPNSQLAYFSYRNGSKIEEFQINITRIYSLTLDDQDRVDRPFPSTLQNLRESLPTNPRWTEVLELTNENFVGRDIPPDVLVRPADRNSSKLYLSGTIKHGDLQKILLEVQAQDRAKKEFSISRSDLVKWIRGR
jgi:hypothetical protein